MKSISKSILFLSILAGIAACSNSTGSFDATGNFEADEVIVSAEAIGRILEFSIDEGKEVKAGESVGYIDTLQLSLKKKQLQYSIRAVQARQPDALIQLSTIETQMETARREQKRVENLLKDDAATQKQLDDINAQLDLLQKQFNATRSSLSITSQSLYSETLPLKAQVEQLDDQIRRSVIVNPVSGSVLAKYAAKDEMTATGKALYKVADLSSLTLRAYISGNQLAGIKLGQSVTIQVDNPEGGYKSYEGKITWVADKAEFTPKTIQTKDERANLVYAIKIAVKNDGLLKIGMYGEVTFANKK
jgi:HlyD family secretion protein